MATVKELKKAYSRALDCSNRLMCALEELSVIASEAYGQELTADICNGGEIEFRTADDPDGLNGGGTIVLEDIIERL